MSEQLAVRTDWKFLDGWSITCPDCGWTETYFACNGPRDLTGMIRRHKAGCPGRQIRENRVREIIREELEAQARGQE